MNNAFLYKHLLIVLAAGTILGSCSKSFVTKTPSNNLPTPDALNSASALQSDLNGTYAEIRNVDQFGRDFLVIGDLMADNTFVEARNSGRYLYQYADAIPVTDQVTRDMWGESYTGILRCNNIIDANVSGTDAIKAQAYAIRALLYFKLVNIWATPYTSDSSAMGVPLVLHYNVTATPARSSVGAVYRQIVSDLTKAFATAPAYVNSVTLSKYAIEGLLARVYMYMGDYTDALTAAKDVINNGPFTLVSANSFLSFWANPGVHTDAVEVMFEIDCDPVNNNAFDDLGAIYINGYQDIYCSSQLAGLFDSTDVRLFLLIQGTTKSGALAYLVNKFPNAQNNDRDNLKVIRLAEVYLIAAESAARLGQTTAAQGYVNSVAQTRDGAFGGYTDSGPALIADIVQERRKELAFEGDRLFDMNRLGLPINRATNNGSVAQGNGLSIAYPNDYRISPLPQQELLANPNIAKQQNPGY
ncbi:RagB/SusD family nutrient uptake outer membrane protein [Puia dinghuensis]|uniref:Membrane protein n=1 Tax=Puia dinghuensis TaxID=1792502 RepID=A0A8J2UEI9_9BACT|nr:RagB/SusD family nutrient uptake outer membrane protein [Puia dinghuensis]GGB04464.1 membrane protein [Puia dinghuensis]